MFIGHFKGQPTDHVMKFVDGKVTRQGPGLSFYYLTYRASIVVVPTQSMDAAFIFQEMTGAFQTVSIQGQFTYRIQTPDEAAHLLNFTIDPHTRQYLSEDPERLSRRITNIVQMEMRRAVSSRTLEEVLRDSTDLAAIVLAEIQNRRLVAHLGVELISLHVLATKPVPEMARALEAESREGLLRRADEAIYARRRAAVDEERTIKESELSTDTALEEQRAQLIALEGANIEQKAEHRARAIAAEMQAFGASDPRTLLAVALKRLGDNAGKIGSLTVTTEMLASILNAPAGPQGNPQ